jgi:outer membrane immunogenic protein
MKTLKTALLGATLLLGSTAAASAGGLYRQPAPSMKDPVYTAPAMSWTGFYVGAHLGGTVSDDVDIEYAGWRWDDDLDNGALFGGHIGYNLQTSGNLVLGIEADLSGSSADAMDYLGSVRGRLGLAVDNTLFYTTAGVAYLGWDDDDNFGWNADDSSVGWVAGLGVEHKLSNNLSVGLEGLYYSFSEDADVYNGVGRLVASDVDVDRDIFAIRGRLTYHFGGDSAGLK